MARRHGFVRGFLLLAAVLLWPAAGGAVVESETDLGLNLGMLIPTGGSQGTMAKATGVGLTADWWMWEHCALTWEYQHIMSHAIPTSDRSIYRPTPIFNLDRAMAEARSDLDKEGQPYTISPVLGGGLKRSAFYFAPGIKFGRSSEGARAIVRKYVSLAVGLFHSVLSGSVSFTGAFANGDGLNNTQPIERKISDDLGLSFGVGIMYRKMGGKFVWGADLRYYRILKEGDNYPEVMISPTLRFGWLW